MNKPLLTSPYQGRNIKKISMNYSSYLFFIHTMSQPVFESLKYTLSTRFTIIIKSHLHLIELCHLYPNLNWCALSVSISSAFFAVHHLPLSSTSIHTKIPPSWGSHVNRSLFISQMLLPCSIALLFISSTIRVILDIATLLSHIWFPIIPIASLKILFIWF